MDAIDFLREVVLQQQNETTLVYLDPPYYEQGKNLYFSYYEKEDHVDIAKTLADFVNYKWVVSYDNCSEISEIYKAYRQFPFDLNYSVQSAHRGKELMVFSNAIIVPENFRVSSEETALILS